MKWNSNGGTVKVERLTDRVMVEQLRWKYTIFTRKVTDIAFTSEFCNNYSHPASLYLTSRCPHPTRPRIPYLMSSSPLSRVPNSQVPTHASQCPHPLVPVPLLYTAPQKEKTMTQEKQKKRGGEKVKRKSQNYLEILLSAHAQTSQANTLHRDQKAMKYTRLNSFVVSFSSL